MIAAGLHGLARRLHPAAGIAPPAYSLAQPTSLTAGPGY